jgi:Fuc2NAc and GlcNAc transferase
VTLAPAAGLVVFTTALGAAGTWAYRQYALRRGIVANPNARTLHAQPTPRGGGVAIAGAFLAAAAIFWLLEPGGRPMAAALGAGGLIAAVAGFVDDRHDIPQRYKLATHTLLVVWAMACAGGRPLVPLPFVPILVSQAVSLLALVWLINLYNFVDGIDGMAASGAVAICVLLGIALWLRRADSSLVVVTALPGAAALGFLVFNWPPARIFMGDAGSLFLGYAFAALAARTVTHGEISAWTWLCIFGYFASDTTTTTTIRMLRTRRFYEGHRSHAYQNLARILGSHFLVLRGVLLYQVLWLLPLTIWSVLQPGLAPLAALLAVGPAVGWTLKYGPRLSSS